MKRLLLLSGILFSIMSLQAQVLSPEVVATAGKSLSSPSYLIDFTVGEVVISTLAGGSNTLTQGFHQPKIIFVSTDKSDDEFTFSLYPNPTEQFVTVESTRPTEMQIRLYDAVGHTVKTSDLFTHKITLDLQSLATGYYLMVITDVSGNTLFNYRVMKTTQ